MQVRNFVLYTLISLVAFCGLLIVNKFQIGFYGMAWGSFLFGAILVLLAIQIITSRGKVISAVEYAAMAIIAFVLFCKGWILLFHGLNKVYLAGLILLGMINLWNLWKLFEEKVLLDGKTFRQRALLRIAVIIFILAEVLYIFNLNIYIYLAVLALVIAIVVFLSIIYIQTRHFFENQKLGNVIGIDSFKSYWLLLGFLLFFSYRIGVNYELTDEVTFYRLPTEYVELFYRAENGEEEPVDGKYEYQVFLESYDEFMDEFVRNKE